MSNKTRSRNFCGVCYLEQIDCIRSFLVDYSNRGIIRAYYLIKHEPETEEKQIHFHFLIEFYDCKTKSAVCTTYLSLFMQLSFSALISNL